MTDTSKAPSHAPQGGDANLGLVARFVRATELDTRMLGMVGALLLIWAGFHLYGVIFKDGGNFLTPRNLWNLSVQTSMTGIMATGMVLVIITRNIDLSVGSIVGVKFLDPSAGSTVFPVSGKTKSAGLRADGTSVWDLYTTGTNVYLARYTFTSTTNTLALQKTSVSISSMAPQALAGISTTAYLMVALLTEVRIFDMTSLSELSPISALTLADNILTGSMSRNAFTASSTQFALSLLTDRGASGVDLRILTLNFVASCTISNCITCGYTTPETCTKCVAAYLISVDSQSCISSSAIPAGYGPDTSAPNPKLIACTDSNCGQCNTNSSICSICKPGYDVSSGS